jgi:hypothetical protein
METTGSDDAIATSLPKTCEETLKFDVDLPRLFQEHVKKGRNSISICFSTAVTGLEMMRCATSAVELNV